MNERNQKTAQNAPRMSNATRLRIFLGLCLSLAAMLVVISCRAKAEKRSFSEVKGFDTPVQNQEIQMPKTPAHAAVVPDAEAAPPSGHMKWKLPHGWTERAGTGMFYALIKTSADAGADEIGVLSLPGEAGGLPANAERWAGQLGVDLSGDRTQGFLARGRKVKSKGHLEVTLLDFGPLVPNEQAASMMVAITKPQDDSYFIKMRGTKGELAKHEKEFAEFCSSLVYE